MKLTKNNKLYQYRVITLVATLVIPIVVNVVGGFDREWHQILFAFHTFLLSTKILLVVQHKCARRKVHRSCISRGHPFFSSICFNFEWF